MKKPQSDKPKNRRSFNTDIWTITAIIMSFCALGVSIYESIIMRNQQYASVWPYLEPNIKYSNYTFELAIANKGTGPAIIKEVGLVMDGISYKPSVEFAKKLLRREQFRTISINSINNSVIAIGESLQAINVEVSDTGTVIPTDFPQRVSLKICYCSIFGDCWQYVDGEVTPKNTCIE